MLVVILLAWTTANCCPVVTAARNAGYTDEQIEQRARELSVPDWIIVWAKKHCHWHACKLQHRFRAHRLFNGPGKI